MLPDWFDDAIRTVAQALVVLLLGLYLIVCGGIAAILLGQAVLGVIERLWTRISKTNSSPETERKMGKR